MDRPSVTRRLCFTSDYSLQRRYLLTDEPVKANFRFEMLLEVLDKLAEDTALAYVNRFVPDARVVTAAIDSIRIRGAPDVTQDMILRAQLNYVGRTSLEVGIRVEQPGDPFAHIASCYFTMVAQLGRGKEGKPVLPGLEYTDELQQTRAAKAKRRREAYQQSCDAAEEPPTREEYALLAPLHAAQEQPGFNGLLAGDLATSGWERTYPEHENVPKKIFGGHVIHRALMYSVICAEQVAPDRPVLISVNRINFHHPVRIGDKLHFVSRVTYTGNSSICVETDIVRVSLDRTSTALSNTCIFTFVNCDADLRRQPVPQIYPTTYAEDARYLAAYRRQRTYKSSQASAA